MQHFDAESVPHRERGHICFTERCFLAFKGIVIDFSVERVEKIAVETVFLILVFHEIGDVDVFAGNAQVLFDLPKQVGKLTRKGLREVLDVFQKYLGISCNSTGSILFPFLCEAT